ncbi:hypothetical protein CYMTET_54377 [Cymbomonas tetramitiformis]|uniref:Uncharacterized protein n=1 Tax=Cymbomonas tetramitiformis TaxID=36881 RepID=A0AAE0BG88_9CHLO|nr:hypothetical protein CYMTET_54377 [Cymbomonas tetramitiformis]
MGGCTTARSKTLVSFAPGHPRANDSASGGPHLVVDGGGDALLGLTPLPASLTHVSIYGVLNNENSGVTLCIFCTSCTTTFSTFEPLTLILDLEHDYEFYHVTLNEILFTVLPSVLRGNALAIFHEVAEDHPTDGRFALQRLWYDVEGVPDADRNRFWGEIRNTILDETVDPAHQLAVIRKLGDKHRKIVQDCDDAARVTDLWHVLSNSAKSSPYITPVYLVVVRELRADAHTDTRGACPYQCKEAFAPSKHLASSPSAPPRPPPPGATAAALVPAIPVIEESAMTLVQPHIEDSGAQDPLSSQEVRHTDKPHVPPCLAHYGSDNDMDFPAFQHVAPTLSWEPAVPSTFTLANHLQETSGAVHPWKD